MRLDYDTIQKEAGMLAEVSTDTFEQEVLQSDVPVLVDFWGPRCVPCLALKPEIEKLGKETLGKLKIVGVDASKNKRLCLNLKVLGLPTFLIFKDGEEVKRLQGAELKIKHIKEAANKVLSDS
jgi:thioredoxin 1